MTAKLIKDDLAPNLWAWMLKVVKIAQNGHKRAIKCQNVLFKPIQAKYVLGYVNVLFSGNVILCVIRN